MNQLTVTIITLNEELDLPRALDSIAGVADEVLVVDSGSTDRTGEIAREQGGRVRHRDWTNYSDQKNYAAGEAAHDWIFSLDADEALSPALRNSLLRWKENKPEFQAYAVRRRANYLGEWINHCGWYPDTKIRLYHRRHARFEGALHENVHHDGRTEELEGDLHHYTVRTFAEHTERVARYTTIAALGLFSENRRHWLLPMLVSPPWTFLRTCLLQQGFRDGYRGWLISRMAAYYTFLKYWKLGVLVRGGSLAPEPGSDNA
jgi:glycosyltransferase involved in cell wall biosynthesis